MGQSQTQLDTISKFEKNLVTGEAATQPQQRAFFLNPTRFSKSLFFCIPTDFTKFIWNFETKSREKERKIKSEKKLEIWETEKKQPEQWAFNRFKF